MSNYRRALLSAIPGLILCVAAWPDAHADDSDALALADKVAPLAAASSPWTVAAEASWFNAYSDSPKSGERASIDMGYRRAFSPAWSVAFSDRLDGLRDTRSRAVNTLKEAYVDWRDDDAVIVDLGRVNQHIGVAVGYNPTDVFKSNAIRDAISQNPDSLRSDRLGVAMLRGQFLWRDGALTGIVAPRLDGVSSDAPFSADFGATNNENRWVLMGNQQLAASFSPQWLLFGTGRGAPHAGVNLNAGLGAATILYLEWSGGSERPQYAAANGTAVRSSFQNKASLGMTYTTSASISLTLEYEFNQAALNGVQARQAIAADPQRYGGYLAYSSAQQENSARQTYFGYASWDKFLSPNADLRLYVKYAPADRSSMVWTQYLYKFDNLDVGLERDLNHGAALSAYGPSPGLPRWQLTCAYYF
jgi:hypothetical protein